MTRYGGGQDQTIDELLLPGYEKDQVGVEFGVCRFFRVSFNGESGVETHREGGDAWILREMFGCPVFFMNSKATITSTKKGQDYVKINVCRDEIVGILHVFAGVTLHVFTNAGGTRKNKAAQLRSESFVINQDSMRWDINNSFSWYLKG